MGKKKVVFDTNVLLEDPALLLDDTIEPIIPMTVLEELDDLKRRPNLAYAARKAIRTINENRERINILGVESFDDASTNDNVIIKVAKESGAILYTEDVSMRVKASALDIDVHNPITLDIDRDDYTGYTLIDLDDYNGEGTKLYNEIYAHAGFDKRVSIPIELVASMTDKLPNEMEYLVIRYTKNQEGERGEAIYKLDAKNNIFRRKVQKSIPVSDNQRFAVRDFAQEIALISAINLDVPATIIDGAVGTGKSLLAVSAALYLKNSKNLRNIYVTRPPTGIDNRFELGFLPGNIEEKMNPWLGGILSNLEYLFGTGAESVFKDSFVHFPINMAQGYSLHKSILIVDEAQLMSISLMKQILSRVADGSKLIILGDENQNYGIVPRAEMGLRRLKSLLPIDGVEYVKLDKIYRGKLAEVSLKL